MTKDKAIKVLEMVEAHGIANEAKEIAIEALKTEAIPIEFIEQYVYKHGLYTCAMEVISAWREERKEE